MTAGTNRDPRIQVAVLYGSTREGRFCDVVGGWAAAQIAERPELALDIIDPLEIDLPARHTQEDDAAVRALRARIGAADAFVVVTPEYNHSFPAALKFVIDSAHEEWRAKPVGFVSYGGVSGGLRAVEQLRLVFGELHAVAIRDSVSFSNAWSRFDERGAPVDAEAAGRSMSRMLDSLRWWAVALHRARTSTPYPAAA